jgi:hypothetical protein
MKAMVFSFIISLLFLSGCSKNGNPTNNEVNTYSYEISFQFNTHFRPTTLTIDDENGFIYITNGHHYFLSDDQKILKYDLTGKLISTIADFRNSTNGLYPKYLPIDLTLDNDNNISVLVKPYHKQENEDYWEPYKGFCIMTYSASGGYLDELDFSQLELDFNPEAMTFKNGMYYVTNSFSLFKISKSSGQLTEIPLPTIPDNSFPKYLVSDMAVDEGENIWFTGQTIVDTQAISSYISKMDSRCNQLYTFNSVRQAADYPAEISKPSIILDENGNVYITTFYCKSLEIYNSSGLLLGDFDFKKEINESTLPIDFGIDKSKNIYVLDYSNNMVYVLKNKKE